MTRNQAEAGEGNKQNLNTLLLPGEPKLSCNSSKNILGSPQVCWTHGGYDRILLHTGLSFQHWSKTHPKHPLPLASPAALPEL